MCGGNNNAAGGADEADSLLRLGLRLALISRLVVAGAFEALALASPYAELPGLRLGLGGLVLSLQAAELRARLRLVGRREPHLQHLQADVTADEEPPHEDGGYDPVILIAPVYLGAHPPPQYVVREPGQRIGREGLGRPSEVGAFWRIDTGDADRYLFRRG